MDSAADESKNGSQSDARLPRSPQTRVLWRMHCVDTYHNDQSYKMIIKLESLLLCIKELYKTVCLILLLYIHNLQQGNVLLWLAKEQFHEKETGMKCWAPDTLFLKLKYYALFKLILKHCIMLCKEPRGAGS